MHQAKLKFYTIHFIVLLITLACLLMNGPMRGGLPIDSSVAERMSFIASYTSLWSGAWVVWMFCALGLLVFCIILSDEIKSEFRKTLGLFLVALGVAPDLTAEVIYAFVLPKAIELGVSQDTYLLLEHAAALLTGFLGNGLYNLGGMLLTYLAIKQGLFKTWVALWGMLAWGLGIGLSVAIALGNLKAAEIFTASSMVISTLWMLVFAYQVLRPKWITQS